MLNKEPDHLNQQGKDVRPVLRVGAPAAPLRLLNKVRYPDGMAERHRSPLTPVKAKANKDNVVSFALFKDS